MSSPKRWISTGLRRVLTGIHDGSIRTLAVDTPVPSQFAHEILNANPYAFLDDAPLEERRARAVQLRRMLPEAVLNEVGRLDQEAIAHVREQARPEVRDADELHDALQTLVALPEELADEGWQRAALGWVPYLARVAGELARRTSDGRRAAILRCLGARCRLRNDLSRRRSLRLRHRNCRRAAPRETMPCWPW